MADVDRSLIETREIFIKIQGYDPIGLRELRQDVVPQYVKLDIRLFDDPKPHEKVLGYRLAHDSDEHRIIIIAYLKFDDQFLNIDPMSLFFIEEISCGTFSSNGTLTINEYARLHSFEKSFGDEKYVTIKHEFRWRKMR